MGDESPKSDKLKVVQKNPRLALHQSENVIFDSRRMKRVPDKAVERELRKWGGEIKSVEHLVFVNRHAEVIVIK